MDASRIMHRCKRDVRLKHYLMTIIYVTEEDIPRLHIKNEKWQPPRAIGTIESCLRAFDDNIV